jgi:hypothetical protein
MMKMIGAPLVYVGPTASAEAIQRAYPGCIVRPPIRRGDLYRDRMLRGAVFLILDGVFFQDEAISPREVLDVIADGALVAGAASMGALRAAECWPAGMRGVGAIYRLFRSGVLDSDDEVAVAFSERPGGASSSVALINVRYAVRQAQRSGVLDSGEARRIVSAARGLFYADRYWPLILRAAGLADRAPLATALAAHDLKARDAARALEQMKRWLREEPSLLDRPRVTRQGFTPSEERREREHDAQAFCVEANLVALQSTSRAVEFAAHAAFEPHRGANTASAFEQATSHVGRQVPEHELASHAASDARACGTESPSLTGAELRRALARRVFASGRYLRYAAPLAAAAELLSRTTGRARPAGALAQPALVRAAEARTSPAPGGAAALAPSQLEIDPSNAMRAAYVAVATQATRDRALLRAFVADEATYSNLLWLALDASAELDAELFRLHAQRMAAARALADGPTPTSLDRCAAELRIATSHGFPSWAALMDALEDCPEARVLILEHCRDATLAQAAIRREFAHTA